MLSPINRSPLPLLNARSLSISDYPKLAVETDDSGRFNRAITDSIAKNKKLILDENLTIFSPTTVTSYIEIEGLGGTITDIYGGSQSFTQITYTGTGTFLTIDGTASPSTSSVYPSGSKVSNLIVKGTYSADSAFKVNQRGCTATSMRNVTYQNVFAHDFTSGWGFELHEVYTPTLINCNVENCGGTVLMYNAHATTFIGGSLEQCAFGVYNHLSRPVTFTGTTIEGIQASRAGCTVPTGFTVWSGWANSDNPRTTVSEYAGLAIVSFGGQVVLDGIYVEGNDWTVAAELDSQITIRDSYLEADSNTIGTVDFAGTFLEFVGNSVQGNPSKTHIYLESSVPPNFCYVRENSTNNLSAGKFINNMTNLAGIVESQDAWGRTINHYNTSLTMDGLTANRSVEGINKLAAAVNSGAGASWQLGTTDLYRNIYQQLNNSDMTYKLAAGNLIEGKKIRFIIECVTTASTFHFSTDFKGTAATYSLNAGGTQVLDFTCINGVYHLVNSATY